MTMLSFRLEDSEAEAASTWAERLGIDRSELLREAVRRHLQRLGAEAEADSWSDAPGDEVTALAAIAEWGPAEDWSDWTDAEG